MKKVVTTFSFLSSWLVIGTASAQALITGGIEGCNNFNGMMSAECVPNFIAHVIAFLFSITGTFCILMIILSGYEYILGSLPGGSLGSKESAVTRLRLALVGFIISALAFFILDFFIGAIGGDVNI